MNFLGHIYFSDNDPSLMYANLYGDFVKGSDLSVYSPEIRRGIILHRAIDQYIDHHPAVLSLMHKLYSELPKVTGIAVDLYFDHILASRWNEFHPVQYRSYLNSFYNFSIDDNEDYSEEFRSFIRLLKERDWMVYYALREGLTKMCEGVKSRLSFKNALSDAPSVYDNHKHEIHQVFDEYMHDAIPHFKALRKSLT